ncbi:T9SS type A sorting domain-containing protein, partial [Marivirga sp.]|uniref:T9SS type A sorting domain-containing protein n=1 Tax=Marivirga sp. TaxID=2018662 RepID=UPI0025CE1143
RAPKTDYPDKNVADQQTEPSSLWRAYQDVIATRNTQQALRTGNYSTITSIDNSIFSFIRQENAEQIIVVTNLTGDSKSNVSLNLASSNLIAGSYQLVDLLSGNQMNFTVNSGGSFNMDIVEMEAHSTHIYKLMTAEQSKSSVELMVDMNELIEQEGFNPDTESVILISSENAMGAEEQTLLDEDGDGIFTLALANIGIGSSIDFKFGINEVENGREEFPNSGKLRAYRVKEGENQVLNTYNQLTSAITAVNKDFKNELKLKIYPNPAQKHINIDGSDFSQATYQIIDIKGLVKSSGKLDNNNYQISINDLNSGLYFIQVITDKQIISKRFVVRK